MTSKELFFMLCVGCGMTDGFCKEPVIQVMPASQMPIKTVIFDLGDVVFSTAQFGMFPQNRVKELIKEHPELLSFFKQASVRKEVVRFLHEVSDGMAVHDPSMLSLFPAILVDWLTGMSSDEARTHVEKHLEKSHHTEGMRKVWGVVSDHLFSPELLVSSVVVMEPVAELIRSLKEQGYQLYVLSNWDVTSFPLLMEKHKDLLLLFDGIMISGEERMGKPNQALYTALLTRYALDPASCLFIDDMSENIKAAEKVGIRGVRMETCDGLLDSLEQLGLVVRNCQE